MCTEMSSARILPSGKSTESRPSGGGSARTKERKWRMFMRPVAYGSNSAHASTKASVCSDLRRYSCQTSRVTSYQAGPDGFHVWQATFHSSLWTRIGVTGAAARPNLASRQVRFIHVSTSRFCAFWNSSRMMAIIMLSTTKLAITV